MDARLVEVESPLHGIVASIERGVGHEVGRYSPVVTIEAGMTRVAVQAGVDGTIEEVRAVLGAEVEPGYVLVVVAATPGDGPISLRLVDDLHDEVVDVADDDVDAEVVDDEVVGAEVVGDEVVGAEVVGDEVVADEVVGEAQTMVCTQCGSDQLEPGFVEDRGRGSGGYGHWAQGRLEVGLFGGARRMGKQRRAIEAYRCVRCSHLELFTARDEEWM